MFLKCLNLITTFQQFFDLNDSGSRKLSIKSYLSDLIALHLLLSKTWSLYMVYMFKISTKLSIHMYLK
jgi:hypothetical protein